MKIIITERQYKRILREQLEKSDRHYRRLDIISDHVQLPYFKSMEGLTIYEKDDQEYIMEKILGNITIKEDTIYNEDGEVLYHEDQDEDEWQKWVYDDNGNLIHSVDSDGWWEKQEYDDRGNKIYYESSNGYWVKYVYDERGNKIYKEDSEDDKMDRR
jgi:YD repeat-containing protein